MDGILLVDKKSGDLSFDIVKKVRRILRTKKVGHAGTLDSFATGLLIILINQGTKLFPFIMSKEKRYLATIFLGIETDTFDCTGEIVSKKDVPCVDEEYIKRKLNDFIGLLEQTPPVFSAIKQNGVRAYRLARKGIDIKLKKRAVHIYDIRLISWSYPELSIEVRCSPGTYIRSLAVDISRSLGTCGHLKKLRRLSCGPFQVDQAISITAGVTKEFLKKRIISLVDALPDFRTISVDASTAWKLRNGLQPMINDSRIKEGYVKFVKEKELVAIGSVNANGGIRLERVFN